MPENGKEKSEETKEQRFKRIATRRVNNTLNALRVLRACADQNTYEYTDAQARQIQKAIMAEASVTTDALVNRQKEGAPSFSL